MSIILWIVIIVTLRNILFKISCVTIYRHNQLKGLNWIGFSCVFSVGLRSLIHNASAIFRFHLLLWKILSIIIKPTVLTFSCDFSMLCFKTCDMWPLPLWSFILSIIRRAFSNHNHQRKLVQGIWYHKLNHGYLQGQFCLWHWNNCSV